MSKKKTYVLTNRLSVGMMEELCKQVKNKKAVFQIADQKGLGVTPILRGFVQTGKRGKGNGIVLCGDFDFNQEEDEEDHIDPTEDADLPFDPDNMTPEKMAMVYAFHDRVRSHLDAIDDEECEMGACILREPSDCENVEQTKGIEYLA